MRILFCASPGVGHVEPMVPLLRALLRRGHVVGWAGATESHARVQALGVERCFAVGPSSADTRAEYQRRWPQRTNGVGPAMDPLVFPRRFGALLAPAMLDPLVQAIETWSPALVISEVGVLAAPLACKLTGCAQVTHGFGMGPPADLLGQAADAFAEVWRKRASASPPPDAGLFSRLYLDIYPSRLQAADQLRLAPRQCLQPCTPSPEDGGPTSDALAARLDEFRERPLVYLTFGTVVNHSRALIAAATALGDLKVRLVVTVGTDGDPHLLNAPPPNVQVERFVEQAALLPRCDLVVSHGGSGTFLAALTHGLPQLVLPQGADQFSNASALELSGAGMALRGEDINVARIRDCVQRLLLCSAYRVEAAKIADHISAMPCAEEVAVRLEKL